MLRLGEFVIFVGIVLERLLLVILKVCRSGNFLNFVGKGFVNLLLNKVIFCNVVIVVNEVGMVLVMILLWILSFWRFIRFLILGVRELFSCFVGSVMEMMCFCVYLMFV